MTRRALSLSFLFSASLLSAAACGDGGDGAPDARDPEDARIISDGPSADASLPVRSALWILGDPLIDNRYQLIRHVHGDPLPIDMPPVVLPGGTAMLPSNHGNGVFGAFDVRADGRMVAFAADLDVTGRADLYVASYDGSGVVRVAAMPEGRNVDRIRFSPDGQRIAFRADYDVNNRRDVYVVPADGQDVTPDRVTPNRDEDTNLGALFFEWTLDSRYVLLTGEFTDPDHREFWIADATADRPTPRPMIPRSRIQATGGGQKGVIGPPTVTIHGRVLFKTRMDADNEFKLHEVDLNGSNLELLPGSRMPRGNGTFTEVGAFTLSPDGSMLAFTADPVAGAYEVFVMPVGGSDTPERLTAGTAATGRYPRHNEPLMWSPDGTRIAFIADYIVNTKYEPFLVTVPGDGTQRRLSIIGDAQDAARDATALAWADDSTLYMIADHRVDNDFELFTLDAGAVEQEPALALDVVARGDVTGIRVTANPDAD